MDPNMMGLMGMMGGSETPLDPEAAKRAMMLRMLMGQKQQGGHAGGMAHMGNSLMSALLMKPELGMMMQNKIAGMFGPSGVGGIGEG
tara:strand:+ start:168 stop:428 length:261 start_codon:yes stop_codon:yes gene_type:complete